MLAWLQLQRTGVGESKFFPSTIASNTLCMYPFIVSMSSYEIFVMLCLLHIHLKVCLLSLYPICQLLRNAVCFRNRYCSTPSLVSINYDWVIQRSKLRVLLTWMTKIVSLSDNSYLTRVVWSYLTFWGAFPSPKASFNYIIQAYHKFIKIRFYWDFQDHCMQTPSIRIQNQCRMVIIPIFCKNFAFSRLLLSSVY